MPPEASPSEFARLYRQAFVRYGTRALWNKRQFEPPTPSAPWRRSVAWAPNGRWRARRRLRVREA